MNETDVAVLLRDITDELKSLVEINRVQSENIIENNRVLNSLFNRQMALEKAIVSTMHPGEKEIFETVFNSSLKENYA